MSDLNADPNSPRNCPCCGQSVSGLYVHLYDNVVCFDGKEIKLQPQEARILMRLLQAWPVTVLSETLIDASDSNCRADYPGRVVYVRICQLRLKLEKIGIKIMTVARTGYRVDLGKGAGLSPTIKLSRYRPRRLRDEGVIDAPIHHGDIRDRQITVEDDKLLQRLKMVG